ncbi:MAG: hypothetical protein GY771_17100 [bacterium]|nr:hypothetical protein [bacterium]
MAVYDDISRFLKKSDREAALQSFKTYLDEIGGPDNESSDGHDPVREINAEFTVWEQIVLYNHEVERRPDNPRSWKLLGYAYMCAGGYVPLLLYLAEHCLHASIARYGNNPLIDNLEDKLDVIERVRRGDTDARVQLLGLEAGVAGAFDEFPERVPVPRIFYENNIIASPEIEINESALVMDILEDETEYETDEVSDNGFLDNFDEGTYNN